ncbi:MAG: glycosyltransferase [Dehalococcoidia bacterium]|nr:glycosyltransferase [Dehalococcoidia bacterium]
MKPNTDPDLYLSLIVPTYNERDNIEPLLERVHKALSSYKYELILVDDNSPDGTAQMAESLASKYPVQVVLRTNERGLASAVVAGFGQAAGRILGVMDADLQHPPEAIPAMLDAMQGGADMVIGSRYVEGGGMEEWDSRRELISRVAKRITGLFLPSVRGIKDPLAGFFFLRREVVDGVKLAPTGYKILLEVLMKGRAAKVVEVPYVFRGRERGKSNLTFKEELNFLRHLSRLIWFQGDAKRFLKFCVVGATGFGVNFGGFWLLTRLANLYDLWALIIALEVSILSNYTLNHLWTFRDKSTGGKRAFFVRAVKFNLVSAGAIAIYYAIYIPLTRFAGVYDLLALFLAILVGLVWNFSVNFVWTWKVRSASTVPTDR